MFLVALSVALTAPVADAALIRWDYGGVVTQDTIYLDKGDVVVGDRVQGFFTYDPQGTIVDAGLTIGNFRLDLISTGVIARRPGDLNLIAQGLYEANDGFADQNVAVLFASDGLFGSLPDSAPALVDLKDAVGFVQATRSRSQVIFNIDELSSTSIPEPSPIVLMSLALGTVSFRRRLGSDRCNRVSRASIGLAKRSKHS